MKKLTTIALASLLLGTSLINTGCFGEFALVRKVYGWNEDIGGNDMNGRVVRTLVFWGLNIIPVYGIASFIDYIILNLIEFWTGSNPMAMKEGEKETQVIAFQNVKYEVTATKNKFTIVPLEGANKGKVSELEFVPESKAWVLNNENGSQMLGQTASYAMAY